VMFIDLAARDALLLLARAPDPTRAAKLTRPQLVAALRAARRHHVEEKADALLRLLRAPGLRQAPVLEGAYASVVVGQVGVITALNAQIAQLQEVVGEHFLRHPEAGLRTTMTSRWRARTVTGSLGPACLRVWTASARSTRWWPSMRRRNSLQNKQQAR